MKYIKIENGEGNPFTTAAVITQVAQGDGKAGLNVSDIRERIRIMDAVDAAKHGYVALEDGLHKKLVQLVNEFSFMFAHRGLLTTLDGIINAPDGIPNAIREVEADAEKEA